MERIGIRELRQNASRYLALVARGERVEITDRGRPVAILVPLRGERWEELLATGRVMPPSDAIDVADEAPADYGIDTTGALAAMRELER
jgi:prevent-host-death family protein